MNFPQAPRIASILLPVLCALLLERAPASATLALDENFNAPWFAEPVFADRALLLPSGHLLRFQNTDTTKNARAGAITRYSSTGEFDPSFQFDRAYRQVSAAAALPNGQLIVAATRYLYYSSFPVEEILRLNGDGSVDPSFIAPVVTFGGFPLVRNILVQPDGKILVTGAFDTFNGVSRSRIVRLLADGTLDSGFTGPAFNGWIWAKPVVLADGKILLAGSFTNVGGASSLGITRLNDDGTVDPAFQPSGFRTSGRAIWALAVQTDGRIVMAGRIQLGASGSGPFVSLFRSNGSADNSLAVESPNSTGLDVALQSDGKIVVAIGRVWRFTADGVVDSGFTRPAVLDATVPNAPLAGTTRELAIQGDGRILFVGRFTSVNDASATPAPRFGAARSLADGSLDSSFTTPGKTGVEVLPRTFARLPDGSTVVAFGRSIEGASPNTLVRLLPDGSRGSDLALTSSHPNSILAAGFRPWTITELPDDGLFLDGTTQAGGFVAGKFFADGREDLGFSAEHRPFQQAASAPDGKVLLAAGDDPQATVYDTLTRLRSDGNRFCLSVGPTVRLFQIERDFVGVIMRLHVGSHVLAVQPDGKVLLAYLSSTDQQFHLVRLNFNGAKDATFAESTFAPARLSTSFPFLFDPLTQRNIQPPGGVTTA